MASTLLIFGSFLIVPGILWLLAIWMERRLPQWRRDRARHPGRRFYVWWMAGIAAMLPLSFLVNSHLDANSTQFASLVAGQSAINGVISGTGVKLNPGQSGFSARSLNAVADGSLTLGDLLVAAASGAAGRATESGTALTLSTPAGTLVRTFVLTLDVNGNPTARN